jgi:CheY-like chemotaxis protein
MSEAQSDVTILVIDDDPDVLAYLGAVFTDRGWRVLTAGDGERGLELARQEGPDLICLDISMPPPTGVRVYRELRGDPALREIPVVMVTGVMKQFEGFIKSRRQVPPPDGYVSKPFEAGEVLQVVEGLLQARVLA